MTESTQSKLLIAVQMTQIVAGILEQCRDEQRHHLRDLSALPYAANSFAIDQAPEDVREIRIASRSLNDAIGSLSRLV